jgi:hypothetical protein
LTEEFTSGFHEAISRFSKHRVLFPDLFSADSAKSALVKARQRPPPVPVATQDVDDCDKAHHKNQTKFYNSFHFFVYIVLLKWYDVQRIRVMTKEIIYDFSLSCRSDKRGRFF